MKEATHVTMMRFADPNNALAVWAWGIDRLQHRGIVLSTATAARIPCRPKRRCTFPSATATISAFVVLREIRFGELIFFLFLPQYRGMPVTYSLRSSGEGIFVVHACRNNALC